MRAVVVVLVLSVAGTAGSGPARASADCGTPGAAWSSAAPADVGLDAVRLQEALDWATQHQSFSVAVVRHGCLAGASMLDPVTAGMQHHGWSMTKSVTSMVVGRAVTLGLLDIDAPIGPLFPEADESHARITPRQLLTMSSGLRLNWVRDLNPVMPDRVRDALALPFDHDPGTYWEYHQGPCTLLAEAVTRAVGMDIQDFAQQELFGKIGISRDAWTWDRDRAGHTEGWAHLNLRTDDWARLGYLMLRDGRWNGEQLISADYVHQAISSAGSNHAYGLLFWLNGKDSFVMPAVNGRDEGTGTLIPSAPDDTFIMAGQDIQRNYIIPSLDMVIVRIGQRGSYDLDTRISVFTARAGEFDYEFMRRLMLAVTDAPVPAVPAYPGSSLVLPGAGDGSIAGDARETDEVLAGFGLGPAAPAGCTPVGCA
jgi:CubicO group peptidase (beta-lactamase class C family)